MKAGINEGQTQRIEHGRNTGIGFRLSNAKAKIDSGRINEEVELIKALNDAKKEWVDSFTAFEHVYEDDLIDYYTYKLKACESRYAYFLRKARDMGIKAGAATGDDVSAYVK